MEIYDEFIFNSSQYLAARGLPSNSYSMNGTYVHTYVRTYILINIHMNTYYYAPIILSE